MIMEVGQKGFDQSKLWLKLMVTLKLTHRCQAPGDNGKVHGSNTNCHVVSFQVNSGGSFMMSKIATGCSGEGREVPLTLPTTYHKKIYFTHQSKQIPCIRMALIVVLMNRTRL